MIALAIGCTFGTALTLWYCVRRADRDLALIKEQRDFWQTEWAKAQNGWSIDTDRYLDRIDELEAVIAEKDRALRLHLIGQEAA